LSTRLIQKLNPSCRAIARHSTSTFCRSISTSHCVSLPSIFLLVFLSGCFRYVPPSEAKLNEHVKREALAIRNNEGAPVEVRESANKIFAVASMLGERLLRVSSATPSATAESFEDDLQAAQASEEKIDFAKKSLFAAVTTAATSPTGQGVLALALSTIAGWFALRRRQSEKEAEASRRFADTYRNTLPEAAREAIEGRLEEVAEKHGLPSSTVATFKSWLATPDQEPKNV
jgi:hypothetical protein